MKRLLFAVAITLSATNAAAQPLADVTADALDHHVLPGFAQLAAQSKALADAAADDCNVTSPELTTAYGAAFDAWISVSHLRFGPTEVDDRAFALAFWPDSRGVTPRSLLSLIASEDPFGLDADAYTDVSIAARGFYALEFLFYDDTVSAAGSDAYRCALIQTITADIAALTQAIDAEWRDSYAGLLRAPSENGPYRTQEEAAQELFKAVLTGLEFLGETRLGRPLGTLDRPRPTRAEVWRSGRSARHVALSLAATQDLALRLAGDDVALAAGLNGVFDHARSRVDLLDDPSFAAVVDPTGRFKIEAVQLAVGGIHTMVRDELGFKLGVIAGFNALDGD